MRGDNNQQIIAKCIKDAEVISCWDGEGAIEKVFKNSENPDSIKIRVAFENGTEKVFNVPEAFRTSVLIFK